jgi:hypothetical protein
LDFEKAVVEFGTEAVLRYRTIAEARHDNELPESFLRGFVAMGLHERFGCQVHVERLYTAMALDLGMPITPDFVNVLGAFRADIAVYESGRPFAVIELKIFDAASPLPSVGLELDKAQILARFAKLRILVGVMICPIVVSLEARIERLHDAFGGNMYIGERQHSRDRQWQWCFACASLDEREGVRFVLAGALLDTQRKCRRVRVETEHLRSADIVTARIDEYALAFCLGMIFSENRIPLFRIMP